MTENQQSDQFFLLSGVWTTALITSANSSAHAGLAAFGIRLMSELPVLVGCDKENIAALTDSGADNCDMPHGPHCCITLEIEADGCNSTSAGA